MAEFTFSHARVPSLEHHIDRVTRTEERRAETFARLWVQCLHHFIDYHEFDRVEFVLCSPELLSINGETFIGIFLGERMFIANTVPRAWAMLIPLQLEMERRLHIDLKPPQAVRSKGLYQLVVEKLLAARMIGEEGEYDRFLQWRNEAERGLIFQAVQELEQELAIAEDEAREVPPPTQERRAPRSLRMHARWVGNNHSAELVAKLLEDGTLEEVYQVLCRLAGAGLDEEVLIPREWARVAYRLSDDHEMARPLITITDESNPIHWRIRHRNGKTRPTVLAFLRVVCGHVPVRSPDPIPFTLNALRS